MGMLSSIFKLTEVENREIILDILGKDANAKIIDCRCEDGTFTKK